MKHLFYFILAGFIIFISLCYAKIPNNDTQYIHFAVAAEYPPFEYNDHGELKGFDIDLARLIAKKLNKEALFDTMQFSSILPAISTGQVDAAISTLTITEQRKRISILLSLTISRVWRLSSQIKPRSATYNN